MNLGIGPVFHWEINIDMCCFKQSKAHFPASFALWQRWCGHSSRPGEKFVVVEQPDCIRSQPRLSEPCPFWRRTNQRLVLQRLLMAFDGFWWLLGLLASGLAEKHWNESSKSSRKAMARRILTITYYRDIVTMTDSNDTWDVNHYSLFFFNHDTLQVPQVPSSVEVFSTPWHKWIVALLPSAFPVSPAATLNFVLGPGGKQGSGHLGVAGSI